MALALAVGPVPTWEMESEAKSAVMEVRWSDALVEVVCVLLHPQPPSPLPPPPPPPLLLLPTFLQPGAVARDVALVRNAPSYYPVPLPEEAGLLSNVRSGYG